MNQTSRSDYYFGGDDELVRQYGRVQAGELIGNIDSMEDELRRYYNSADINCMIVEGIVSSVPLTKRNKSMNTLSVRGTCRPSTLFTYKVTETGFLCGERDWPISPSMYFAWLDGLDGAGVRTYSTINHVETAKLLVAAYQRAQKPTSERTTLNRYYRPRINIKEQNPFISALMNLSLAYKLGIGEAKATALAQKFNSITDVCIADESEICQCEGVGRTLAHKLLVALGREKADD